MLTGSLQHYGFNARVEIGLHGSTPKKSWRNSFFMLYSFEDGEYRDFRKQINYPNQFFDEVRVAGTGRFAFGFGFEKVKRLNLFGDQEWFLMVPFGTLMSFYPERIYKYEYRTTSNYGKSTDIKVKFHAYLGFGLQRKNWAATLIFGGGSNAKISTYVPLYSR